MKEFKTMTVGGIVADDFKYAEVFSRYKIDFCCNGSDSIQEACRKAGADVDMIIGELQAAPSDVSATVDFKSWPTDLLADYILKFHHRNIRAQGPEIAALLDKVSHVHGHNHPELYEVRELFSRSLADLENHLQKEEMILFPYIYQLCDAQASGTSAPSFHCGSITGPIAVMMAEHDAEGERYRYISGLTDSYTAPAGTCGSYRLALQKLKAFEAALHHHIHLENNILFPGAVKLESRCCR